MRLGSGVVFLCEEHQKNFQKEGITSSAQRSRRGALYSGLDGSGGPRRRLLLLFIPGVDGFFRGIRGGIWRDMAGYGGVWRDTGRYREIPGDTRYGQIRADTGRCGKIRGDARRCKEIRGDTVRYCRDTSRYRKKTVRTRAPGDALMAIVLCGSIPSNTLAPHFVDA